MESGAIPDSSITASSYMLESGWDRIPQYSRLHSDRFWASAGSDSKPWIQTDLGSGHMVTGLQTAGNNDTICWGYWVEQITVKIGMNEEDLVFIESTNGQPKVSVLGHLFVLWCNELPLVL